jgi:flavodoxin
MEIGLVYYSKTGNTEKVANTISKELKIKPVKIDKVKKLKYDLVIIGSPTNAFKPRPEIVDFIDQVEAKYAAVFSTCARISSVDWMEKRLRSRGIKVIGRFSCHGELKLPFGDISLNKGKPDAGDLAEAKHFVKLIKKKLGNLRL